jgi:hypothetical protein
MARWILILVIELAVLGMAAPAQAQTYCSVSSFGMFDNYSW